ncbi:MAG: hypothetical protein O2955_01685 [Planctomycetota bacterium]|nr:hypothetical protein [Planctomycetota bacterium]MDA1211195.1 hypothetical protein [Planctomycetota bacterium]
MVQRGGKGMIRQPATKFAHLQKKMSHAQQSKHNVRSGVAKKKGDKSS